MRPSRSSQDHISRHWQNFRDHGGVYLLQRAASKTEHLWSRLLRRAQAVGCSGYRLVGQRLPAGLRRSQVEEAHKRALGRYSVQLYPGKITLMRAADVPETVGTHRNSTLGWETFAGGGLEIHDVPGGHISMFEEPNVGPLAETLKALLPSNEGSPPRKGQAEAFPPDSHSDNSQLGQSLADENDLGDVGDACPPSLGSWQLQSFKVSR